MDFMDIINLALFTIKANPGIFLLSLLVFGLWEMGSIISKPEKSWQWKLWMITGLAVVIWGGYAFLT